MTETARTANTRDHTKKNRARIRVRAARVVARTIDHRATKKPAKTMNRRTIADPIWTIKAHRHHLITEIARAQAHRNRISRATTIKMTDPK